MAEVINISDDEVIEFEEVPKQPKRKAFKCLNSECRNEKNLIKASVNIRRFYSVLSYPKKTKVCTKCAAYAKVHCNAMVDSVRSGKLILSLVHNQCKNTVVLSESDSDLTDNEPDSEESEIEYDPEELYGGTSLQTKPLNPSDDYDEHDPQERIRELIGSITNDLKLKEQIEEGAKSVTTRLNEAELGFQTLNDEFKKIETSLDNLRNNFYDAFKQDIKFLPAIEIGPPVSYNQILLDSNAEVIAEQSFFNPQKDLPPMGPLVRPEIRTYEKVYSIKYSLFARWVEATVMGIEKKEAGCKSYKICYVKNNHAEKVLGRTIPGRHIAYFNACPTRIPVGTRIIARYKDEDQKPMEGGSFYVGIIAEIPTGANKHRYLIFFDDGYAQYVNHSDVRVVVETSTQPFEDVASDSREFIKDYLHTYPERPMVRLQKNNFIKTEWNGRWWKAQVLEVDASLVKMFFPMDGRTEWIYRGSTRLSPLFNKKMNIQSKAEQVNKTIRRRTLPFNKSAPVVEYVNMSQEQDQEQNSAPTAPVEKRAVARKSTTGRPGTPPQEVQEQIYHESRGFIRKKPIQNIALPKFTPHQCSKTCDLSTKTSEEIVSPLLKPILRDWRRQISKERKKTVSRNVISYVAPCGRRLRSMEEVFRFLRLVESDLEIDFFSFDIAIDPTNEWEPAKKNIFLSDISSGIENIPISCVNSLDKNHPTDLIYCNVRQPIEHVNLNLDPNFLVQCNCTDDCQDKSRCECWQLTTEGTKYLGMGEDADIGYRFRRLHESVATGIYECNSRCSCKNTCLNRVVQHPIKQKLQLFKTARRGWGVRTLHDIPQGAFICVYVGKVLNEAVANLEGKMTTGGDDYYAELDFIEVVENMKEGYESEVEDDADEDSSSKNVSKIRISTVETSENGPEPASLNDDDDIDFDVSPIERMSLEHREPSARLQARAKRSESSNSSTNNSGNSSPERDVEDEEGNDEQQRQPQTFEPTQVTRPPKQYRAARELYGPDEKVYIMDAKVSGNIGRYFNHSCQPNIFVQNVFVDTHDIRFPWVAFFASMRIRAGTELTWDYNYEVGSVPGKIKYCYCMSKKCRGRLL
ncbi:UNVERIFIED_CONTAM: hypothetical protein RMT77_002520 [Armadillidium vulgare]